MDKAQSAAPAESGPALAAPAAPAKRPSGYVPVALAALYRRPAAEMEAATRLVQAFELKADAWDEDAPLWRGWAVHQAFLLGAAWKERHG